MCASVFFFALFSDISVIPGWVPTHFVLCCDVSIAYGMSAIIFIGKVQRTSASEYTLPECRPTVMVL
jgi:hypothetical protein